MARPLTSDRIAQKLDVHLWISSSACNRDFLQLPAIQVFVSFLRTYLTDRSSLNSIQKAGSCVMFDLHYGACSCDVLRYILFRPVAHKCLGRGLRQLEINRGISRRGSVQPPPSQWREITVHCAFEIQRTWQQIATNTPAKS